MSVSTIASMKKNKRRISAFNFHKFSPPKNYARPFFIKTIVGSTPDLFILEINTKALNFHSILSGFGVVNCFSLRNVFGKGWKVGWVPVSLIEMN